MDRSQQTRYIFVTGGVISGLGKGIAAASLGAVFRARGLKITMQKCDPYLNVDAGTLRPAEHGECFVTYDGAETDLDLGHYERFLDVELSQRSSTMSGRLLLQLITDERAGKFGGEDVQMVPHFTDAIQKDIIKAGEGSDIHIVEIGGTVGDYESLAFIEAIREMEHKMPDRCSFVHVVYVPFLGTSKEFKTKPAQNALRDLRSVGIIPNLVLVRAETEPPKSSLAKISLFGGVPIDCVIPLPNASTVYQVPLTLREHAAGGKLLKSLGLDDSEPDMSKWRKIVKAATTKYSRTVRIGLVAKYLDNDDTYLSVIESLRSAAWANKTNLDLVWVDAEKLQKGSLAELDMLQGILVPGGFGQRALEGKIRAAGYAMDKKIPYLGICLGMQMAVVAAARKAGLKDASSFELDPKSKHPVVYIMAGQHGKETTGGTMRLGNYPAVLLKDSLMAKIYGKTKAIERHRHRYEVNQEYNEYFEKAGLVLSGKSPDGKLVEMIEHKNHPYFVGTQAHPEFLSRPDRPHPLFNGLIAAALKR